MPERKPYEDQPTAITVVLPGDTRAVTLRLPREAGRGERPLAAGDYWFIADPTAAAVDGRGIG
ncbi:hypothetical protein AB0D46_03285 [Streptomyces sp. NPDC048383]|uniref:hypothetical protein n=1 Tax=Streptomyces sp. NPDC048383 TaxID=3155386 RepID=UPI0034281F3E